MRQISEEDKLLINRIESKWTEISNGLMQFTGSVKPLLLLEFQGYMDYLKVIEKIISYWEIKSLDIKHQVGPHYIDGRFLRLDTKANLEIFTPGIVGPLRINLTYSNDNKPKKTFSRWQSILEDL